MRRHIIYIALVLAGALSCGAQVRWHDEAADTARINDMVAQVTASKARGGDAVAAFGRLMMDTPYVGHTLEGDPEMLTINIGQLDCTTFVETALAMALAVDERRTSWRDVAYNLQRIRYRGGNVNGYPSRLHYIVDWAVDNVHRGNFKDVTTTFDRYNYVTRSIDYMTAHADRYPALADSANLAGIKNVEMGYRNHRFPYIKTIDLSNKVVKGEFRNGDILAFVSNLKDLDVTHMGMVVIEDGVPYVLHASSSEGRVARSALPLNEFMKKNRQFIGVRVFRVQAP